MRDKLSGLFMSVLVALAIAGLAAIGVSMTAGPPPQQASVSSVQPTVERHLAPVTAQTIAPTTTLPPTTTTTAPIRAARRTPPTSAPTLQYAYPRVDVTITNDYPCHPSYTPCIPDDGTDVDCAGRPGDGPRFVQGPVKVNGYDEYKLDADRNGVGCEG